MSLKVFEADRGGILRQVDDLPDRGSEQIITKIENRMILWLIRKNPYLSLHGGQILLRRKRCHVIL